jgi:Mg-chelatase subunit ChlD
MQHDFILLDRSGSMASMWAEALSSVNTYVDSLVKDNVDTGVTLAAFDTEPRTGRLAFEIVRDRIIPRTWRRVTSEDCAPRNNTPLNDAIGRIVSLAKAGDYARVAIIIITDGMENASMEYSHGAARALLDGCRNRGWQVIFMGANFDNRMQAGSYNNDINATLSAASGQMVNSMRATASKRAAYGVTGQSIAYTAEEKAELEKGLIKPATSSKP